MNPEHRIFQNLVIMKIVKQKSPCIITDGIRNSIVKEDLGREHKGWIWEAQIDRVIMREEVIVACVVQKVSKLTALSYSFIHPI